VHGFDDVAAVAYVDMNLQPHGALGRRVSPSRASSRIDAPLDVGFAMAEEPGDHQPGPERRRTVVTTQAVDESGLKQLLGQAVTQEVEPEPAAFRPVLGARP
jgi:hypothetical protein